MKEASKRLGRAGLVVIGILVLIVVSAAIYVFAANVGGQADRAANPGREKSVLFDPNNSIGSYEQFYDKCRAAIAIGQKAKDAEAEAKSRAASYNQKQDPFGNEQHAISAVRENARALRAQQIDTAQEYNADSSKTTKAQFKAADLPYTIDAPYDHVGCGNAKSAGR